jgi:phenylacetate-CoA ligase
MTAPVWDLRSATPGVAWPAIPGPGAAPLLALQFQLDHSQWLAPDRLQALQHAQLERLARHTYDTVPFYRERWRGAYDPARPLTPEAFRRLPLLTRHEVQAQFHELSSTAIPPAHGKVAESRTSGSTGQPVRVLKTGLDQLMWQAIVLREHGWFGRDLGLKLASIRQGVQEAEADGWGPATDAVARTGRSATLPIRTDVRSQLQWLQRQQPDYLLTYPSNLAELAKVSRASGIRLPRLREARTFGEILPPETRDLCREAWGVPVTDAYSSDEAGYIALQCPVSGHYHAQSECVLVEVLDDRDRPCAAGEVGRVVVTALHNFAMPLVRYELCDFAEPGPACRCGRGLPVLRRIVGRVRNMLTTADGRKYWPALGTRAIAEIAPVLQYQVVQKTPELVEARMVTASPLSAEQERRIEQHLESRLPPGLQIVLVYCDRIPRGAGGKFEDFISEVAAPPA